MCGNSKVVPYLDVPLQHVSPRVLERMGRTGPRRHRADARLGGASATCRPGLSAPQHIHRRFSGRTRRRLCRVGRFSRTCADSSMSACSLSLRSLTRRRRTAQPSPRRGERIAAGPTTARPIGDRWSRALVLVGTRLTVLVESETTADEAILFDGKPRWRGRSYRDAPEIDGATYIQSTDPLTPGELIVVRLRNQTCMILQVLRSRKFPVRPTKSE